MTVVNENARLELLRSMAETHDVLSAMTERGELNWNGWTPLHEDFAENNEEDFRLAARECAALGLIDLHIDDEGDYAVRLRPAGYDWIRAHDAIGEAMQERAS